LKKGARIISINGQTVEFQTFKSIKATLKTEQLPKTVIFRLPCEESSPESEINNRIFSDDDIVIQPQSPPQKKEQDSNVLLIPKAEIISVSPKNRTPLQIFYPPGKF
jgi:hypothetical protein